MDCVHPSSVDISSGLFTIDGIENRHEIRSHLTDKNNVLVIFIGFNCGEGEGEGEAT